MHNDTVSHLLESFTQHKKRTKLKPRIRDLIRSESVEAREESRRHKEKHLRKIRGDNAQKRALKEKEILDIL